MNKVVLATFNEGPPARKLQERLEAAGVFAGVRDESKLERFGYMSHPFAAVHLDVPPESYAAAYSLVVEWHRADGALKDALHCPACNSMRVEFPQITRKFVTPALVSLLMALRILTREFYCLDCHFTWPTANTVPPKLDVLGWPYDSKTWHPERARYHRSVRSSAFLSGRTGGKTSPPKWRTQWW